MEKIIIFDTHKAYARLFRQEFGAYYEINSNLVSDQLKPEKLKEYSFAFIIIHEYEELVHIIPLIQTIPNLIIGSKLNNIEDIARFSENIMFVGLNETKYELLAELTEILELFSKNPPHFESKFRPLKKIS